MERINGNYKVRMGASPKESDIAFTSIDSDGSPGRLNQYVLKEFGYSEKELPKQDQLIAGFSALSKTGKRSILFVVTLGAGNTSDNLKKNLYNTLTEFHTWFHNKILWLPLMGSGDGGLTLEESYSITVKTINKFLAEYPTSVTFILSLPDDDNGKQLLDKINLTNVTEHEAVDKAFKNYKGNFYLVGTNWNGEEQAEVFYDQSIWKTGYEDKYADIINLVKKDDVIFIKSTFARDNISTLRIKAIGRIIDNINDGQSFKVDWKVKNIKVDIPNLGYYRNTIDRLTEKDLNTILHIIGRETIYNAGLLDIEIWGRSSENIKLDNDTAFSPDDLLDISNEIEVFARLLAQRNLSPPLAIALFGDWGSGKSFFINHLQLRIKQLSESRIVRKDNEDELYYCKNILHISFNAWAYLDANLWVGFMTCIFEKIDEYISGLSKGNAVKSEIKEKLSNELEFIKGQKTNILNKKHGLEQKKKALENDIEKEKQKLDETIKKLIVESWIDRVDLIWNELKIKDKYAEQLERLGLTPEILQKTAREDIQKKVYSFKNYMNQFRSLSGFQLIGTIIFILFLLNLFLVADSGWFNKLVSRSTSIIVTVVFGLSAVIIKIRAAYSFFKPYVDKALNVQLVFNQKLKETERIHQDKITKAQIEKETTSNEIDKLQLEIKKLDNEIEGIDYSLTHALEKIVLADFIKKRSISKDYTDKLGIVSVIRKDLETLSELFVDQKINPSLPEIEKKQLEERKNKLQKIKAEFNGEPIERIILYIDDLDRCSDEKVLEVLQAVHLLMAFPLFIVVVGVDKRCVTNALFQSERSKYYKLHTEGEIISHKIQPIEPNEYLEKIFQIPFQLKEASKEVVDNMIESLLAKDIIYNPDINKTIITHEKTQSDKEEQLSVGSSVISKKEVLSKKDIGPDDLKITEQELIYIKEMSHLVGSSPRTIKRYINMYRLIKAYEGLGNNKSEKEIICTLFNLALNIGKYRADSHEFFDLIKSNKTSLLEDIFKLYSSSSGTEFYNELINHAPVIERIKEYSGNDIIRHLSFIKRFSFNTEKEK
ncbi:MAG: family P-loop domain protein [Bacteroidota bacterium]|nr:family P-loop domain protein [Bacteroidota bacterium]